jgi:3-methyladenine DNA glycosylase AlkD
VPMYEHFVVTGAWWDLVDDVAIHRVAPIRATHPDDVNPVVRRWADDERLWLRRTAVLSQVGSRDAWDPRLLADVLEPNLGRPEPFLRKAVGWALRDASARHPAWVRQYVDDHQDRMSPLARKEALRGLAGPRGPTRPT